ncbi:hypothetical protein [Photobacterium halotolerans]|uniref:hypothetical protein n=1 Tax=Photobacterium halotolerans TaxID=265726 RepID=UPI0004033A50|nr:hypothetical protein [Photobacterium halotolerans]
MTNLETLYDLTLNYISSLVNGEHFDTLTKSIEDESRIESIMKFVEDLKTIESNLTKSKNDNVVNRNTLDYARIIAHNKGYLPDATEYSKIIAILKLQSLFSPEIEFVDDNENIINYHDFDSITEIDNIISLNNYYYSVENQSLDNALIFINLSDKEKILDIVNSEKLTNKLLFLIINSITNSDFGNLERIIIYKKTGTHNKNNVISALKLHIVSSGQAYHNIKRAPSGVNEQILEKITINKPYQQFNDTLLILSEYNSREELLNKYLSLYHVIENFMYKLPLVKLSQFKQGEMFSIRDFRDMYSSIEDKELPSLTNLLSVIFPYHKESENLELLNLKESLRNLVESGDLNEDEFNKSLVKLGIKTKKTQYTYESLMDMNGGALTSFLEVYSKIVYSVRNSIVHNKETEFHLSNENLTHSMELIISKFIINNIEPMLYNLISEQNEHVWYSHSEIKLYA